MPCLGVASLSKAHQLNCSHFSCFVEGKYGLSQRGKHLVQLVLITNFLKSRNKYINVCYIPDIGQKNTDFYLFYDTTERHFLTRYKCVSNGGNQNIQ